MRISCFFLVLLWMVAGAAQAQTTITVNTLTDDADANGNCTFREALQAAEFDRAIDACPAGDGADTITFGVTGTIELQAIGGWRSLSNSVTITGPGPEQLVIDATHAAFERPILDIYGQSEQEVYTVSGITLQGARGEGAGGVAVENALLQLSHTYIIGNEAVDASGSGLYVSNAAAFLEDVLIRENIGSLGGGMTIWGGSQVTARRLTVEGNTARANGGGIFVSGVGTRLILTESVLASNQADANGGGLLVRQSAEAELANVTISGNQSGNTAGGLAVWENSMLHLNNVTVTGNIATNEAGGLGGFSSQPEMRNTIIAANTDSGVAPDIQGAVISTGYNFIGNGQGASGLVNNENGDQVGTSASPLDPMLGLLADNGGRTRTHALLSGSPAQDRGNPDGCLGLGDQPLAIDQRGAERVQGSRCDIGAFEVGSMPTASEDATPLPDGFVLQGNYPNPFNPQTTIRYTLPETAHVRLVVYDVLGREVALLADKTLAAGTHETVFEATGLPSGLYVYRLEAGRHAQVRRMLLAK